MKGSCHSLLLAALSLLLLGLGMGCGQSQSDTAYQEGYRAGFADGRKLGLAQSPPQPQSSSPSQKATQTPKTVTPAPAPPPPTTPAPTRFVRGDLTITPTAAKTGEAVTISIPVSNTGGTAGSYTVVFKVKKVGGFTTSENVDVTLQTFQTKTVTFTTTKNESGTYTVDANGKTGQFTVTAPPPAPPTPEELKAKQVIKDLAYISASAWTYSDDADPEPEGISIRVSYYDSKSQLIPFEGVPVEVTVELYRSSTSPPVYRKQVMVETSGFLGLGTEVLRIPFTDIRIKATILDVVVTTPTQGSFADRGGALWY